MASTSISCRKSIHRELTPASPKTAINLTSDSQKELSDGYESNEADSSEESLTEKLKRGNESKTKNISTRSEDKTEYVTESAINSSQRSCDNSMETQPSSCGNIFIWFFLIIITACFGILIMAFQSEIITKKTCSFKELQKKYPKEGDYLWNHLQIGNEHILNNESDKPAVYLFVHHDKSIAGKLINDIAQTSSKCFDSSPNIKTINFASKEAKEDYGHIIATYKNNVEEGNVILIANLNEIPGKAPKALHAICDTVTPLVKKVIILLSLTVERKKNDEKVIDIAENALYNLWKDKIERHELDPIITRVTDQVLLLQSN